jgi:hypothetical protein
VAVSDGKVDTPYTFCGTLYSANVSGDGTKGSGFSDASSCARGVWDFDITTGAKTNYGGCQGSISVDGHYVTHNTGTHTVADIMKYGTGNTTNSGGDGFGTIVRTFQCAPTGDTYFNQHRFSQHDTAIVLFFASSNSDGGQAGAPTHGWVYNWVTNVYTSIGDGAPTDYYPGSGATDVKASSKIENQAGAIEMQGNSLLYSIGQAGHIRIGLYDLQGRCMRQLLNANQGAGAHTLALDRSLFTASACVVKIDGPSLSRTMRILSVR